MNIIAQATEEINLFIQNIGEWFRSDVEGNKAGEDAILRKFHPDFIMITPGGVAVNFEELSAWLPTVYGVKPDISVEVTDIKAQYVQNDSVLMTYTEFQYREEGDNKRIASALFVRGEDGQLKWHHLQETWSSMVVD
ncbi:DUF4440 domain-containing protein [Pedobacter cryoconitis]|uniref:DUF4440 domain-containing protein n=1 Tax=Pedobacter cryoconitis TaxID=188932 RepID=A0A327TC62_9SPHI|nr:nuclear transport factor 2 family protein [Pedobacter cryoconitis]RAJ37223.1 hypothetical protein LY11_00299 [Pedobacter cryoconitis]